MMYQSKLNKYSENEKNCPKPLKTVFDNTKFYVLIFELNVITFLYRTKWDKTNNSEQQINNCLH